MKITEIRGIAASRGIKHVNLFKTELIKAIQTSEGNFDCYGTARHGICDQGECCWRGDCFVVSNPDCRI